MPPVMVPPVLTVSVCVPLSVKLVRNLSTALVVLSAEEIRAGNRVALVEDLGERVAVRSRRAYWSNEWVRRVAVVGVDVEWWCPPVSLSVN